MANVHGFDNRDQGNREQTSVSGRSLLDYDEVIEKDPRKENLVNMLHLSLCPSLTIYSFCIIVSILNILTFAFQVFYDGVKTEGKFLEVKVTGKFLLAFGKMKVPIEKKLEVYRLLSCLFMHGHFSHLLNNSVSILIWGSLVEKLIGRWRTAAIYLIGGRLGSL